MKTMYVVKAYSRIDLTLEELHRIIVAKMVSEKLSNEKMNEKMNKCFTEILRILKKRDVNQCLYFDDLRKIQILLCNLARFPHPIEFEDVEISSRDRKLKNIDNRIPLSIYTWKKGQPRYVQKKKEKVKQSMEIAINFFNRTFDKNVVVKKYN